jgi:hypothetical protein
LFLSTARAALATGLGSVGFRKGAWAQAAGSPTAMQFPDSTVLPTPTPPFAGFIEPNLAQSTPGWPPTIMPPAGAPDVLLVSIYDHRPGVTGVIDKQLVAAGMTPWVPIVSWSWAPSARTIFTANWPQEECGSSALNVGRDRAAYQLASG